MCEALLEPNLFLSQPLLSFLAAFSGPYGHQSGTMSLVPGVVYGAGFCHSKAWWRLFILAPPRVPDLASGRTLTALAAPSASSKVFSRNFSKGSHFAHGDPYFPPHQEETRLRYATRHLPMQRSVGPFRAICARSFGSAPVNWPCCRGLFMALTPASSECKIQVNPPPPYGYWGPFGPLRLSEIEVGTHMFTGKREK